MTLTNGTTLRYGIDDNGRIRAGVSIARWLLQRIEDMHGNQVDIEYDRSDAGTAYPLSVSYADGFRNVAFLYDDHPDVLGFDDRPDELHDFEGGIERVVTKRLREIQVTSGGAVFQRRVFGYAQPGEYTTVRSRLAWTQLFGTDCPTSQALGLAEGPLTAPLGAGLCTPLPAQRYDYTGADPAWVEDSAWAPPADLLFAPDAGTDQNVADPGVRFADVDGDGRVDFVQAYCTRGAWPCDDFDEGDRAVYLNTGSGWQESPEWTEALRNLTYDQPSVALQLTFVYPNVHACEMDVSSVTRGVVFSEYDYYMFAAEFGPNRQVEPRQ